MTERKIDDTELNKVSGGTGVKGPQPEKDPSTGGGHDVDTGVPGTGGEFGQG